MAIYMYNAKVSILLCGSGVGGSPFLFFWGVFLVWVLVWFWLRCLILFVFTLTAIGDRNVLRSTFHDKHNGQKHRPIAAAGDGQKVKNSFETPFVVLIFGNAS